nr:uncharacterized protein LOC107407973 [Ziziphus jujuba var. spinosa]
MGRDVVTMIHNVFRSGLIPRDINRSFVVLISKVTGVTEFKHLRLISLYNTVYKIISKIIADRLRPILRKIISPNQSAFVPGRWIGENTILVNEVVHAMNRKKGLKEIAGIKVYMQKAYDRMNWVVMTRLLTLFSFSEKFTKLILNCISSISMELLLNGSIFGRILMERGLRQGDPMSPFLFIIMAELLSRMLFKWESDKKFNGVKLGRLSPSISHIILSIEKNEDVSSHAMCQRKTKFAIKRCFKMKELDRNTKHLDLPLFIARNKSVAIEDFKSKIEVKLQGWKAKLLSQVGRATFVSHVVNAVPVHTMSSFLLPKGWCEKIEQSTRAFLWRNDVKKSRDFHPVAWSRIRKLLAEGLCFKIGKGYLVDIWEDSCIPNTPSFLSNPKIQPCESFGMVSSLKLENGKWDEDRLHSMFDQDSIAHIKEIFWATNNQEDKLIWTRTKNGVYSVKSGYKLLEKDEQQDESWWTILWKSHIHERSKLFFWKLVNFGLPVFANLVNQGVGVANPSYVHGCSETENEVHVFFHCQVARRIWFSNPWVFRWEGFDSNDLLFFVKCLAHPENVLPVHEEDREKFFMFSVLTLEHLWWLRNKVLHEGHNQCFNASPSVIQNRFKEISYAYSREEHCKRIKGALLQQVNQRRDFPHHDFIKINIDAAVRNNYSFFVDDCPK